VCRLESACGWAPSHEHEAFLGEGQTDYPLSLDNEANSLQRLHKIPTRNVGG
jgi:hypothetical protein